MGKSAVIDVGGGMRGIYAVGVFDRLMEKGLTFDLGIGVSAGSANLASFVAGQKGRNYRFYTVYSFRRKYMGFSNLLLRHSFIDLDYVYGTLSNEGGEDPLDYQAFVANPMDYLVVATDARTGKAVYFEKKSIEKNHYDALKASSCLPGVSRPYVIAGVPYYDGALSDPVPVQKALDCGAEKVVLVLTKPAAVPRQVGSDAKVAKRIEKSYPEAAKNLRDRTRRYNEGVALALRLQKEGKALVVSPKDTFGVTTLTKDKESLDRLYREGYEDATAIEGFLER